jgi:hypothetical protein
MTIFYNSLQYSDFSNLFDLYLKAMKTGILIFFLFFTLSAQGQNLKRIVDLRGTWKFSIGDRPEWSNPDFNDNNWDNIRVPSSWENEGFHGYDGYAWYRTSFYLSKDNSGRSFYLQLGSIDDADECYVNGHLVGSTGSFPPDYVTAYNVYRQYSVPQKYLKLNQENIIAVRVYDSKMEGGIMNGNVGLYYLETILADYNLEGSWKFRTGDDITWKSPDYNDQSWKDIIVPSNWENQGYMDYDGFAWYRTNFSLPEKYKDQKLVLLMGKIDDFDEVYLNGVLIGSMGDFDSKEAHGEWTQTRGYFIPDGILKDKNNVIAVRVYDGFMGGGIYQGPVGLVRQEKYTKFWQSQKKKKNIFHVIFGD